MKMSPQMRRAQENMGPGVIAAAGFLGDDRRPLADIIAADEEAMRLMELTFEEVAERMRHFLVEGQRGLGEPIGVDEQWLVRADESRGVLPCPFEDGIRRKINITVTHVDSDVSVLYSELSIHLFEAHHFLQGKGSPFRLEPRALKAVFYR